MNMFQSSSNVLTDHSKAVSSFVDPHCVFLCFVFVFGIMSSLFIAALWSPAGEGLASWLSCM